MDTYLDNLSQNKNINRFHIHFGINLTDNVFKLNTFDRDTLLNLFKNNMIKQTNIKYYLAGNKIKENNKYFKLIQLEDPDIVKKNIFPVSEEIEAMILLYKYEELKETDFPCKMNYHVEKSQTIIEINYIEQIKIILVDDKFLRIELIKDAYIDNTLREFHNLLERINVIFTDNTYN